MENIETMTEVFEFYHKNICDEFNKGLVAAKLYHEREIQFKIEKASKFELGIYLLFRIDKDMYGKQEDDIRAALIDSCMYSMLPPNGERFIAFVDHRMKIYSKIFYYNRDSGQSWTKRIQSRHDWIINAMLHCGNDYDRMTTDDMPLMTVGASEYMIIKHVLLSIENGSIDKLLCLFNFVFRDNNDFTMLSYQELLKRIDTGRKIRSVVVKFPNNRKPGRPGGNR
jgi:hypothetical protein